MGTVPCEPESLCKSSFKRLEPLCQSSPERLESLCQSSSERLGSLCQSLPQGPGSLCRHSCKRLLQTLSKSRGSPKVAFQSSLFPSQSLSARASTSSPKFNGRSERIVHWSAERANSTELASSIFSSNLSYVSNSVLGRFASAPLIAFGVGSLLRRSS